MRSFYGKIETLTKDLTSSVRVSTNTIGATVIKAPKGSEEPIRINTGDKTKIIQLFGYPSAKYPGIAEAIFFNSIRPIWISAPSKDGKYGGVFVTKTGTIPFTQGITTKEITDFSSIPNNETIGTGDGVTTDFTYTIANFQYYKPQTIDIQVDGATINISATDDPIEVLTTTPDIGSGTLDKATGELSFDFTLAPTNREAVTLSNLLDLESDCYFVIVDKNPQVSDRAIRVKMDSNNVFTMEASTLDGNRILSLANSPYTFSLTENYTTANGEKIYIDNIMRDDIYFDYIVNEDLTVTTFVNDTALVWLNGGTRGSDIGIADLTRGWDYFKNKNTYKTNIFFDTTADAGIPALFQALRLTNQQYAHYILPLPKEDSNTTAISTKAGYSTSNRGISFYWNWGEIQDPDSGSVFWTPLTGRVASKYALMDDFFNGLAPSMIDSNNHGGLLGGGIRRMRWDIQDADQVDALETGRVNAIVNDPIYGVMIISQITSQLEETDYTYIGHSRLADLLLENIINQVLPFQVDKLNDVERRAIVKSQAESIVSIVAGAPYNLLEDYLVVCDESNNTAEVRNRREFKLDVIIIFTKFSSKIRFVFTNTPSGTNLEEVLG